MITHDELKRVFKLLKRHEDLLIDAAVDRSGVVDEAAYEVKDIEALIERLKAMQITVITQESTELAIHASGHPAMDELEKMYRWIRPDMAIPVHGEDLHLRAHSKLANAIGVPRQQVGKNGDIFYIAPYRGIRRGAVKTGRLGLRNRKLTPIKE